ncbi:MAG TPA: hypothetical protein VFQ86_02925 [Arachidicoccus soli]|uniref:Uncharacterized protein n=1 Tax=Arachidicoccus soli TaxID=2341117 RepID=A0A386HTQ8_9BACT|nr:hypothetical protein [Arachidicoccus soli]AYD49059.1 hypothetical protein D6B99_16410 [Arachidicoccus soli]HEU0226665.1 hypothetical protein [Arachidicoccus soli]
MNSEIKANKQIKPPSGRSFIFRISNADKQRLKSLAEANNTSMSLCILNLIRRLPVGYKEHEMQQQKFEAVYALAKEINYIGKNINQLTVAIRQINADKKMKEGEFLALLQVLKEYNVKRDSIAEILNNHLF